MNPEAIFTQIESLVAELRRKNENEEKKTKPVKWILLPISGNEVLYCDRCSVDISQQDMHISIHNEQQKVLCEECWEKLEDEEK